MLTGWEREREREVSSYGVPIYYCIHKHPGIRMAKCGDTAGYSGII